MFSVGFLLKFHFSRPVYFLFFVITPTPSFILVFVFNNSRDFPQLIGDSRLFIFKVKVIGSFIGGVGHMTGFSKK